MGADDRVTVGPHALSYGLLFRALLERDEHVGTAWPSGRPARPRWNGRRPEQNQESP
jgi:hypothetical protein